MRDQWTMVTLLFIVSVPSAYCFMIVECPEGQGCQPCTRSPSGFQIYCGKEKTHDSGPHFQVEYRLEGDNDKATFDVLEIKCVNAPKWTDFHLGIDKKMKAVSNVSFTECDIPASIQLISVVSQLFKGSVTGGENLDSPRAMSEFKFNSYGKLRTTLTRTTLEGFNNSIAVDLSHNKLQTVPEDLLSDFANLKTLNLGFNDLQRISPKFLNMSSLQTLILKANSIVLIVKTTFSNVPSLKALDLSENQITEIESHSLDNLKQLRKLNLCENNLSSLPQNFFKFLEELNDLNLSNNNFTRDSLDNIDFSNNNNLKILELSRNKQNLTTIPMRFLPKMYDLEIIKFEDDGIVELPWELFQETLKLDLLSISGNYIATLPTDIFGTGQLDIQITINLSRNSLTDIYDGIFIPRNSLFYLDVSHNRLKFMEKTYYRYPPEIFELNLPIIDFSNNRLTLTGNLNTKKNGIYLPLYDSINTTTELYLENNNISTIHSDWLTAESLRVLRLRNNQFTHLSHLHLCFNSKRTVQLDLRDNKIATIDLSGFESPEFNSSRFNDRETYPVVSVQLANNPVQCDCSIYHLLCYQEKRMDPNIRFLFEVSIEGLTCAGPPELRNIPVASLKSQLLHCRVPRNSPDNRTCPDSCDCFYRVEDHAFLINCSQRDFIQATVDFNPGPSWHTELNLTGNSLTKIPAISPPGLYNVTVLSLSFNRISDLSLSDLPKNLTELYLHGNNLTQLHREDIQYLTDSSTLQRLTLHENPWKCDCDTLDFFYFIQSKQVKFTELQSVTCNASDIPIFKMSSKDICPPSLVMIVGSSMAAIFLLTTAILAAIYCRYKTEIKVWLFAHQLLPWFVNETELDRDKIYDAFISYSHQDEDFVANTLVPKLEEGSRAFKLCVHYRDWLVGDAITEQIARSVANSRRTVVVLSRNFLDSEWGKMEFRTAHTTALNEGRVRVIVIIYGDVGPIDELEPDLAAYMRTNTYIEWSDSWFWKKLRYALPHPVNYT